MLDLNRFSLLTHDSSVTATIVTSAMRDIGYNFHISPLISTLPYALYILGLAIGSLAGPGLSELFSRKLSLLLSLSLFALSQLGVGLSRKIILIFCFRFSGGFFGAIASLVGISVVFDMYHRHQRTIPYVVFFGGFFLGPAFG
jgi:MFS family permease